MTQSCHGLLSRVEFQKRRVSQRAPAGNISRQYIHFQQKQLLSPAGATWKRNNMKRLLSEGRELEDDHHGGHSATIPTPVENWRRTSSNVLHLSVSDTASTVIFPLVVSIEASDAGWFYKASSVVTEEGRSWTAGDCWRAIIVRRPSWILARREEGRRAEPSEGVLDF